MKIAVVGNCQIAPIRIILQACTQGAICDALPSVYQLNASHEYNFMTSLEKSDVVLSQPIEDTYHVPYVRTAELKQRFGKKVIIWPNMYFKGYNPECDVMRDPTHQNFHGPLQDYHSDKILLPFLLGWTKERCEQFLNDEREFDEVFYGGAFEEGLGSLRGRESRCDVVISDFIASGFEYSRLFHIMNHPSLQLIFEMARRMMSVCDIPFHDASWELFRDLDMVWTHFADNRYVHRAYGLRYERQDFFRGVELQKSDGVLGYQTGGAKIYSPIQVVEAFYAFYERNRDAICAHYRSRELLERWSKI